MAGAFRSAELGDAVAGLGRYVLTSCRGTQLANDATVDNGTSFFTQHLVDGWLTQLRTSLYGTTMFQIYQAGSFRWQVNDRGCLVAPQAGPGKYKLPFAWPQGGDSDACATSPHMTVQVKNYNGSPDCKITLNDPTNWQTIDFQTATRGEGQ